MKRSRLAAVIGGATIGLSTLASCGGLLEPEETRTCTEWLTGEEAMSPLNVCNVDTDNLDPVPDEQLTYEEFQERRDAVADEARAVFEEGFDENAGDLKSGQRPCEEWAEVTGRGDDMTCWETDIWPDTPMTEAEYLEFAAVTECWDYLLDNIQEESARVDECNELTDNPPTLEGLR